MLGLSTLSASSFVSTGIHDSNAQGHDAQPKKRGCYDLSGRPVSEDNLKSGIYIIDGKKVMIP